MILVCSVFMSAPSINVALRIRKHEYSRRDKKLAKYPHNQFWNEPGRKDFCILLGGFENESSDDQESQPMRLNILEMFGALLTRTLDMVTLQAYLPKNASVCSYPGVTGLNVSSPLSQWRRGIGECYLTKKARLIRKGAKAFWQHRQGRSANMRSVLRDADASKGDKPTVKIICGMCRNPHSETLDERPQYEISSGKYVRFYRYCQYCPKIGNSIFIPVSGSLPSKLYATICGEVQRERAKQGDIIAQARLDRQRVNRVPNGVS